MTFETFVKIILVINVLMICCIPFHVRRVKKLRSAHDSLKKRHSQLVKASWGKYSARMKRQRQKVSYWKAEYHKLHARYAHGQVCIGKLVRENKALKSQAPTPTPKRRGRAPKE